MEIKKWYKEVEEALEGFKHVMIEISERHRAYKEREKSGLESIRNRINELVKLRN